MYHFIVNPVAGGGNAGKVFDKLKDKLAKEGIEYKYDYTDSVGHATLLAGAAAL